MAENNEIAAIVNANNCVNIWIRLSDEEKEGSWKDPDNKEILTFTNWGSGQPNNSGGPQSWCDMNSKGEWNDLGDDPPGDVRKSCIICEFE